jgi:hypothetical protein
VAFCISRIGVALFPAVRSSSLHPLLSQTLPMLMKQGVSLTMTDYVDFLHELRHVLDTIWREALKSPHHV